MSKSRDAFRTISEVSDWLDVPAHVLRFWESKFSQVKPVKRAGGRRYYRPTDMQLLGGIKKLLHEDGMTIKGVQKLLRENGVKHVAALAPDLEAADTGKTIDAKPAAKPEAKAAPAEAAPDTAPEPQEAKPAEDADPTLKITNIVPIPSAPEGPALTVDLETKTPDAETEDEPEAEAAPAATAPVDVPPDPSDTDSKADARVFQHLRHASHAGLAAKAAEIAPLLDRMQALRDRIPTR